jgi:hypothetical protein
VDPEIFLEMIYIPCLHQGLISDLHQELSAVDPALGVWKVWWYIRNLRIYFCTYVSLRKLTVSMKYLVVFSG